MKPGTPVVEFVDVSFGYGATLALEKISLRVERGSFLALVGPNGGGKSTFVRLVLGLLEPQSGGVTVLGNKPQGAAGRIGYVPQFSLFERDMPISVHELVLQGRLGKRAWWRRLEREDFRVAEASLVDTGIADLADRRSAVFQGGNCNARCWHGRWRPNPSCWSSTSRPRAWIPMPSRTCSPTLRSCARG